MPVRLALAALVALAAPLARADDSMRCDRGIVTVGDLTVDLLGKCGPPSLRERWLEDRDVLAMNLARGLASSERMTSEVEQWTYDFGRNRFLQLVTVRNGRIERIERGSYGYGLPPATEPGRPRLSSCDLSMIRPGDTKVDLLARCGTPASASAWRAPRTTLPTTRPGETLPSLDSTAQVEQWVYNLGPNQFLRIITFEDGRVTKVETGGYGYPD
jgi:hypothetical protein